MVTLVLVGAYERMSRPSFTAIGPGYADPAELDEPAFGIGHNSGTPVEFADNDALVGGIAIWRFRNQLLGTNTSLAATFKQLLKKQIPAEKHAGTWIGSKRGLRRFYARNTGLAK